MSGRASLRRWCCCVIAISLLPRMSIAYAVEAENWSISRLEKIAEESRDAMKTGRFVSIYEYNSSMVPAQYEPNSIRYKHWMVSNYEKHRTQLTVDCNKNSFITKSTELRDLHRLLEKYGLPEKDYETLCKTGEKVVRGKIILVLKPGSVTGREGFLILNNTEGYDVCGTLWAGIIPSRVFSRASDDNAIFTVVDSVEGELLQVEFTYGENGYVRKKIVCDPLLGYRYRRIEHYYKDWLIMEKVASDYRMTDGVPYPFVQKFRRFNEKDDVIIERKKKWKA